MSRANNSKPATTAAAPAKKQTEVVEFVPKLRFTVEIYRHGKFIGRTAVLALDQEDAIRIAAQEYEAGLVKAAAKVKAKAQEQNKK